MGAKRFKVIVRGLISGGNWGNGSSAGPSAANLNNSPANRNSNIGGRSALNCKGQMYVRQGALISAELNGLCILSLGLKYGWVIFVSSGIERKGGCYA